MKKLLNLTAVALLAFSALAHAEEVRVMTSGGFTAAYKILGPKFAAATGNTLDTQLGHRWVRHRRRSPIASHAVNPLT